MVVLTLMKGIPCPYYGDEFGMEGTPEDGTDGTGDDDATRRRCRIAPNQARGPRLACLVVEQKLLKIRKEHPVFSSGLAGDGQHQPRRRGVAARTNHRRAETEDEVGVLVFNWADHEVNLAGGAAAAYRQEGHKSWTARAHAETVLVNDGGKIYGAVRTQLGEGAPLPEAHPPPAPKKQLASTGFSVPGSAAAAADPYAAPPPAPTTAPAYDPYAAPPPAPTTPPARRPLRRATAARRLVAAAGGARRPEFDPYAAPPPPPLDQYKKQRGQ